MSDIMKYIVGKESTGLEEWNETIALSRAREEGIEMSEAHWAVVHFLREYHAEHGTVLHARKLTGILEKEFSAKGGRKYLYTLFPRGPVSQASRIAGLPVPQDSVDPSFGSSQ